MTDEAARADEGLGYAVNAPYYDLIFPEEPRDALAATLRTLLADVRAVAEIGPGTGWFTEVLAGLADEVFAVEPARIMRAALTARLARDPDLARRVTVLPEDALTVRFPVPVDAVVMFNLVMHFSPEQRPALWRRWAEALAPGGLLLIEPQYPQKAEPVPAVTVPGRALGRRRYDVVTRADVAGDDLVRWVNTYRTWDGDALVAEETAEFDCHVISDERLASELTAAGFAPHPADGVHAWRREED
ncbi:methyltransferase domain-containing protein [Spirillospora sp. NPDC052242]